MSRFRTLTFIKFGLIGLPVALTVILAASVYWLLYTASGASWLWSKLENTTAGALRSSHVAGDLASGFIIQDLEYSSDTFELSTRRTEIEAGPGWWPLSIQIRRLALDDVDIVTHSSNEPDDGVKGEVDIDSVLAAMRLPLPLKLHDAVLTNIALRQADEAPVKLLESLSLKAQLDERLVVDQLDLLAPGFEAGLKAYLVLESPFALSAVVQGQYEMAGKSAGVDWRLPFKLELSGDLEEVGFSLASKDNGLQLGALHGAAFALSGTGSMSGILVNRATLTGPGMDLGFNGDLDWSSQSRAGLNAVIRQLDISPWLADWPAGEYLVGELQLSWSENGLKLPVGKLTVAGTDLAFNIAADIDIEANSVNARLDWSNLGWPLATPTADFSSPAGFLSIDGSVDQWLATGQVDVQMGTYPQGHFEVRGEGDRTSARLAILSGNLLEGTITGEAGANWADDLAWDAIIHARGIDPGSLLPDWPGRLDADVEIEAQSRPELFQLDIVSLQGLLRGVPLSARGGLHIADGKLTFNDLEVRTDEAVLNLDGAMDDPAGALVKFSGYLPSVLLQGASGLVELEGRYSNSGNQPLFDVELEAAELAWNGFSIKGLAASTPKTVIAGTLPAFELNAAGLAWQDVILDGLSLSFDAAGEQYKLKANLSGEEFALKGVMTLAPENADDLFAGSWQGLLDELEVAIDQSYDLQLQQPAPFEWSPEAMMLGPVCLHEDAGAGLCLKGDYQSTGDWSLVADAMTFPLDYLREIFALDVSFEQTIEGRLQWHQPHDQAPTGGAKFRISAGRIMDLVDNELLTETNEGRFEFALRNGNLESGVLDLEFPGTGFIDVDFDVLDIVVNGAQKVQGRAVVHLDDINLIGQLALPGVDAIDGVFDSNIQLGGTLTDPAFDGGFKLSKGFIQYSPIGLKLEDIEFSGQVEKRDRGKFKGQFRAGEGIGSIDGDFLFEDFERVQMEVALSGEQLLLISTDALNILTETDLRIRLAPQRLDINGHIRVPSARLTPSNLLLGEVNDSEDLIVESPGGGLQPVADETLPENRFYGQLEVSFGDDVLIEVPGVETSISGSVLYRWSGEPVPLAKGSYTLQGKVDVYGPTLTIRNGSISFPDVPANNPLLNIRAGRDIFGNTQIRSAGVQVIGTLQRPVVEAYTVPVTTEDRAWTLLVTGTDYDPGQGVGGFDVGFYIAPKLYVSYGISLFEDENVISARYDLKRGFGVKVTSGQKETGLDVSYTIDR